jgi:hypothetical protein
MVRLALSTAVSAAMSTHRLSRAVAVVGRMQEKDGDAADVEEIPASDMPIWALLPETVVDCPVQRMTNPDAVRAFSWKPCAEGPGCEQMAARSCRA